MNQMFSKSSVFVPTFIGSFSYKVLKEQILNRTWSKDQSSLVLPNQFDQFHLLQEDALF